MPEGKPDVEPTLVERWLQEQQQWQRTLLGYFDAMVKDDQFLVHLGNAMRGSLLAGKPYPSVSAAQASSAPADDRLDRIIFALNTLQGQVQDLTMTLDELRQRLAGAQPVVPAADAPRRPAARGSKRAPSSSPSAARRRTRG